jgi:hypothetical protein
MRRVRHLSRGGGCCGWEQKCYFLATIAGALAARLFVFPLAFGLTASQYKSLKSDASLTPPNSAYRPSPSAVSAWAKRGLGLAALESGAGMVAQRQAEAEKEAPALALASADAAVTAAGATAAVEADDAVEGTAGTANSWWQVESCGAAVARCSTDCMRCALSNPPNVPITAFGVTALAAEEEGAGVEAAAEAEAEAGVGGAVKRNGVWPHSGGCTESMSRVHSKVSVFRDQTSSKNRSMPLPPANPHHTQNSAQSIQRIHTPTLHTCYNDARADGHTRMHLTTRHHLITCRRRGRGSGCRGSRGRGRGRGGGAGFGAHQLPAQSVQRQNRYVEAGDGSRLVRPTDHIHLLCLHHTHKHKRIVEVRRGKEQAVQKTYF